MTDTSISVKHNGRSYSLSIKYMSEVELGTLASIMMYYHSPVTDTPFQKDLRDAINEHLQPEAFEDNPAAVPVRDTDRVLADEIRELAAQLNEKVNSAVAFGLTVDVQINTLEYMSSGEVSSVEVGIYRRL